MKQNNHIRYAYLAGVVDSDGCISYYAKRNQVRITVNQKDGRAIDYLYGAFGGNVYKSKGPVYRWEIVGKRAQSLLKRLIPFLRIKKHQAELSLQTQKMKDPNLRQSVEDAIKAEKIDYHVSAAVETKRSHSSKDGKR